MCCRLEHGKKLNLSCWPTLRRLYTVLFQKINPKCYRQHFYFFFSYFMQKGILQSLKKYGSYRQFYVTSGSVESGVKKWLKKCKTSNMENSNPHTKFGGNAIYCLGCRLRRNSHNCSFIFQRRVNTASIPSCNKYILCSLACTYTLQIFGKLYSQGLPWVNARKRQSAITFDCEEIHHKYSNKGIQFASSY